MLPPDEGPEPGYIVRPRLCPIPLRVPTCAQSAPLISMPSPMALPCEIPRQLVPTVGQTVAA